MPISNSPRANSRIEFKNEFWATRVGSACGKSRAVVATRKTMSSLKVSLRPRSSATSKEVSMAIVALGSSVFTPWASSAMRRAAPRVMATETDCDDAAAAKSPKLFLVVC